MHKRLRRALALAVLLATTPGPAWAQSPAPNDAARTEARERFDRGIKLFNDGDNAGALAEFKRVDELIPNVLVTYNIGLVYAAMNRPVDAVDALDRVLAAPGTLSADRLARAKQTREEQAKRIALLDITTSVPASVDVDGVETGKTPFEKPIRVASGVHVIGAAASGFAPVRKEVTVAAGEQMRIPLELTPLEARIAHVTVHTRLPGASVVADDKVVGQTPLAQSVTLEPGRHRIELRRPGYVPAQTAVDLGEGATAEVSLDPEEDPASPERGTLALDISETDAVVTVDGRSRGGYVGAFALPSGPHHVVVRRSGFEALERDVTLDAGRTTTIRVSLEPTPVTRAAYVGRVTSQQTWGLVALGAGVVVLGASIGFLVWNGSQKSDARTDLDTAESNIQRRAGICASNTTSFNLTACNGAVTDAQGKIDDANTRAIVGYVGLGVGIAAAGLGGYLLLANDDPHRYDRVERGALRLRLRPTAWLDGRTGGVGLVSSW